MAKSKGGVRGASETVRAGRAIMAGAIAANQAAAVAMTNQEAEMDARLLILRRAALRSLKSTTPPAVSRVLTEYGTLVVGGNRGGVKLSNSGIRSLGHIQPWANHEFQTLITRWVSLGRAPVDRLDVLLTHPQGLAGPYLYKE